MIRRLPFFVFSVICLLLDVGVIFTTFGDPIYTVDVAVFRIDGVKADGEKVVTMGDNHGILSAPDFVSDCYTTIPLIELRIRAGFIRRRDCRVDGVGEKTSRELEALVETPFGFRLTLAP